MKRSDDHEDKPRSLEEGEAIKDASPDGRYCHYGEKLGSGAYKTVLIAFDRETGTQLAWNQIVLDNNIDAEEFKRLYKEISILKQISHPNIIKLHDSWIDEEKGNLIFVTELMTSGTLSQFRKRLPVVSLHVLQGWARQLLSGLDYLHTRSPVIIHRDIKANNIFMDATAEANRVKIGDLGLATLYSGNMRASQMSVIGTPEYMAPEYYTENYNQSVDIWAFGLVILEMVTNRVPYFECNGAAAQIFLKVSRGVLPTALADLRPGPVKDFIHACLLPAETRPSAAQLMTFAFVVSKQEGTTDTVYVPEETTKSPSAGRQTPLSMMPTSPRVFDDSPPDSESTSPSLTREQYDVMLRSTSENTTQNLSKLAKQQQAGEDKVVKPVAAPAALDEEDSSSPASFVATIASSAKRGSLPSGVLGPSPVEPPNGREPLRQVASPEPVAGGSGAVPPALDRRKTDSQVERRKSPDGGSPLTSSSEKDVPLFQRVASGGDLNNNIVKLVLVVDAVEGDKLMMRLIASKTDAKGFVNEKKVSFSFDVSADNVEADAQGLVDALKPEFVTSEHQLVELLSSRIAENMHQTDSGRRLRMAPSPKMEPIATFFNDSVGRSVASSLPAPHTNRASDGMTGLNSHSNSMRSTTEDVKMAREKDIDAKRMEMITRFSNESKDEKTSTTTSSSSVPNTPVMPVLPPSTGPAMFRSSSGDALEML